MTVIRFADVVLDLERGHLERAGAPVNLRPKAFALLTFFVQNRGRVISKDELVAAVWQQVAVTDDALTQTIKDIRRAIGDADATILKSYPKRGYLFSIAAVSPVPTAPVEGEGDRVMSQIDTDTNAVAEPRSTRRVRLLPALGLMIALALGVVFWFTFVSAPEEPSGSPSLLVFAFDDLTPDKSASYLATGIADDLTTDLANFPGLRVLSRRAANAYQGKAGTPQDIGKALDVRYLVQGSVRREGQAVRINVELVDTHDGTAVWARRFEGKWSELLPMQQQLRAGIAEHLSLRADAGMPRPGSTGDVAAYDEFLKASADWRDGSPVAVGRAIEHLRQATRLDPNYGRAWALMAYIYWNSVGVEERQNVFGTSRPQIMQMCLTALSAAEKWPSPLYYQTLSEILVYQTRQDQAVDAASKAISLDPSDPTAYEAMSHAMSFAGRPREALAFAEAADRVDPVSSGWRKFLKALAAFGDDRFADAIQNLDGVGSDRGEVWSNYFALYIKSASLTRLGKKDELRTALAQLNARAEEMHGMNANLLLALGAFPYKNEADGKRLLDALAEAGIPRLPAAFESKRADALTADEFRPLVFGQSVEGVNLRDGSLIRRTTGADGVSSYIYQGEATTGGMATVEQDGLCDWWLGGRNCIAILKDAADPTGTHYFWIDSWDQWRFRVLPK